MSSQVWICVSEGQHWPSPPEPVDESAKRLWQRRNSLYAAKMVQLMSVRARVVFGVDCCTVTTSRADAQKIGLAFAADVDPTLAARIEKDLREFAEKEWNRPLSEPLEKLAKIPRRNLAWTKGVLANSSDQEQQITPAEQREIERQEKEMEMALNNQGPKTMSWGDDE